MIDMLFNHWEGCSPTTMGIVGHVGRRSHVGVMDDKWVWDNGRGKDVKGRDGKESGYI